MSIVIKVENLSKLYKLGIVSSKTISQDLNRWWAKARGREDPCKVIRWELSPNFVKINFVNQGMLEISGRTNDVVERYIKKYFK